MVYNDDGDYSIIIRRKRRKAEKKKGYLSKMSKIFVTGNVDFGSTEDVGTRRSLYTITADRDAVISGNWNRVVAEEDAVFVIGNVSNYGKDETASIISQLHGSKTLIKGRRDKDMDNRYWTDIGFDEVSNYPIIYKDWFVLLPEPPIYSDITMPFFWIFGKYVGVGEHSTFTRKTVCMSIERWNYVPVELNKVIEMLLQT